MCTLIHNAIDSIDPCNKLSTLMVLRCRVFPMATRLGSSVRIDPSLWHDLVRWCRYCLKNMVTSQQDSGTYGDIITLLDKTILPALSYMECNSSVVEEIWSTVKLLSHQSRFGGLPYSIDNSAPLRYNVA